MKKMTFVFMSVSELENVKKLKSDLIFDNTNKIKNGKSLYLLIFCDGCISLPKIS